MSADLKAIQERAERQTTVADAAQAFADRAALLEHIARQSEVVRMLTEALEKNRDDFIRFGAPGYPTPKMVADADAALKAAAEGAKP